MEPALEGSFPLISVYIDCTDIIWFLHTDHTDL